MMQFSPVMPITPSPAMAAGKPATGAANGGAGEEGAFARELEQAIEPPRRPGAALRSALAGLPGLDADAGLTLPSGDADRTAATSDEPTLAVDESAAAAAAAGTASELLANPPVLAPAVDAASAAITNATTAQPGTAAEIDIQQMLAAAAAHAAAGPAAGQTTASAVHPANARRGEDSATAAREIALGASARRELRHGRATLDELRQPTDAGRADDRAGIDAAGSRDGAATATAAPADDAAEPPKLQLLETDRQQSPQRDALADSGRDGGHRSGSEAARGEVLATAAPAAGAAAATPTSAPATQAPPSAPPAEALPRELQLAAPFGSAEFVPRFGAELTLLARDGVQEARLHINPAEMGPIQVQITLDGSQAQVNLVADNSITRQVLEQSMPGLASALRENGLTLTGGGVFEQRQDRRSDGASSASTTPGRGAAGDGDESADAGPPAHVLRRQGVLDVYA